MPIAPLRPCPVPGCAALVAGGYCPTHTRGHAPPRPNPEVRRWYATVRWFRLRRRVLEAAAQTCTACGHVESTLDIDHVTPHRGDPRLFWALDNLQALCKACHSRKTTRDQ